MDVVPATPDHRPRRPVSDASSCACYTNSMNERVVSGVPEVFGSYDVVVVGAGVAGLAYALRLPRGPRVALLTKGVLGESNTRYAQGGLAAAVGVDDAPALHEADTLAAGAGLCDAAAVRRMVDGAPAAVAWLVDLGTRFDRDASGAPVLGREAAHGRRRVLHAGGDATGAEIERALVARVRADPGIDVFEHAVALDLIVAGGRCRGVIAQLAPGADPVALEAPITILAAGGAGRLWATTSNPPGATADGLAMALRASVAVADLEFAQFHPTVLALPGGDPFLVSEAVRGEGAVLRGADGSRFLAAGDGAHPLAELAPRDHVARAIGRQMARDGREWVDLDLRHLDPEAMRVRFPTIARELAGRGLDLATDLIPVAPAAHYFMGGVVAGTAGETSLPGLLALGEAACTGVHGANRLASNSLLEGLVFGLAAADRWGDTAAPAAPWRARGVAPSPTATVPPRSDAASNGPAGETVGELRTALQRAMSRHAAVVRDAAGLATAAAAIAAIAAAIPGAGDGGAARAVWELRNLATAAGAVVDAAARREESRGAHARADFPATDPSLDGLHLIHLIHDDGGWRFGALGDVLDPIRRLAG